MSKTIVILKDAAGYPERLRALQDAHPNVVAVCPPNRDYAHARTCTVPPEWLPSDPNMDMDRRYWFGGHLLGIAAAQQLGLDADFYWFVESDCVASQDRWKSIFGTHADNRADFVGNPFRARAETPQNLWWVHPGTPEWATHFVLPACHRLSRQAVAEVARTAPEMRECFAEQSLASVLERAGLTRASVNVPVTQWNQQTYRTDPATVIRNPRFLQHPVKANTYGP